LRYLILLAGISVLSLLFQPEEPLLRARIDFLNCGRALTMNIIHVFRKYWAKGTKEFALTRSPLIEPICLEFPMLGSVL
jgi:hypothetical protein